MSLKLNPISTINPVLFRITAPYSIDSHIVHSAVCRSKNSKHLGRNQYSRFGKWAGFYYGFAGRNRVNESCHTQK